MSANSDNSTNAETSWYNAVYFFISQHGNKCLLTDIGTRFPRPKSLAGKLSKIVSKDKRMAIEGQAIYIKGKCRC